MKCSIVIRSYNEAEHIGKLLQGLKAQNLKPHEVILVDSGSTDDTVAIAKQFDTKIVYINKQEFTFGRALNIGCAEATGDILVFVSAHVYPVHSTWLENMVAPFEEERVVVSYGRQLGNHMNKFSEHQIFKKWFPAKSVCPQNTYFCNNANCAIRKTDWEKRPYDEELSGLEDLDWAKKAQAEGGWIAYAADGVIVHVHDENWSNVRNRYRREAMAMAKINEEVSFSFLDLVRLLPSNILADYIAASKQKILWRELLSVPLFRFNQLWGTYCGHNGACEVTAELKDTFYFPPSHKQNSMDMADQEVHRINYETLDSKPK